MTNWTEPRRMTATEWRCVRSIFEERGVSREVAEGRPYIPYNRGEDWVAADDGPFAAIPVGQRSATILQDVRGAGGLVMVKHPVPLSSRKLADFPPQLRPTKDATTGSIVNHDHDDPWFRGKRERLTKRVRDHIAEEHDGLDPEGLHNNFRPERHRHRDLGKTARAEHVGGHWHHGVPVPLDDLHTADEAGKYKLPASPLLPNPWEHEHPVPLPRGGCRHRRPPCLTEAEHTDRHLKSYKHKPGQEEGFHQHPDNVPDPQVSYGKRIDVHPLAVPLLKDAGIVFISIEGNLKADAILTYILEHELPWAVVDVPSVGQWRAHELDDFAEEHLAGRQVIIVPDSDWSHPSKLDVQRQAFGLREYLRRLLRTQYGVQVAAAPTPAGEWDPDCPAPHGATHERCPRKVGVDDWLGEGRGHLEDLEVVEREASPRMREWAAAREAMRKDDRPGGDRRNSRTEARLVRLLPLITPVSGEGASSVSSLAAFTSMKRETIADALAGLQWQAVGDEGPLLRLKRIPLTREQAHRGFRMRVVFDADVRFYDDNTWQAEVTVPELTTQAWAWIIHPDYRTPRRPRRTLGALLKSNGHRDPSASRA